MPGGSYALIFTEEAARGLKGLDKATVRQIRKKIAWLAENADGVKHRALSGDLAGLYRLRVGKYRAIYDLNHKHREIVIVQVAHRQDVYEDE